MKIFTLGLLGIEKYKELSFLVKIVLTLSHLQASVEPSFSLNKSVLNHNISEESILAKNAIRDHMLSDGLETQSVVILNELVWCIISDARQKCQN